jgi:hypothetical protein
VRWVAVRHADDHIHIAATLVRQDGRTEWARNDYRHVRAAAMDLERRFGLQSTAPADGTAARRPGARDRLDRVVIRDGRQFVVVAERAGIGRESAVEVATGRVYLVDTRSWPGSCCSSASSSANCCPRSAPSTRGRTRRTTCSAGCARRDPEGMRDGGSWDLHLRDYDL